MNYNKLKNIFEDIYLNIKQLIALKKEINKNILIYNNKKKNLESILINEINNETKKLNKIKLLNNNKIYFNNNDFKISFNNDNLISDINNFTLNYNRNYLFSSIEKTNKVNILEKDFNIENKILKVKLEKKQIINFIQYSFLNIDNTPILPKEIYYNDINSNNILIDNWQYKLKKDILNDEFVNTFIIDPKDIIELYFIFDEQINIEKSNLYLGHNIYKKDSSIIYKIPIKDLNGFLLYKDTMEYYIGLNFYYSINNKDYNQLEFKNNISKLVFDKQQSIESLYIKIKRDNIKYKNTEDKIISKQIILNSSECKLNNISYKLNNYDFNLIVDNQFYFLLKDKLPDFFNKRTDGLIEIKKDYIKRINEINPLQKLSMENNNNINIYDKDNYPLIYLDNNNILWLPYCLSNYNYNFIYYIEEKQEIFKEEDFTPICFSFSLNLI